MLSQEDALIIVLLGVGAFLLYTYYKKRYTPGTISNKIARKLSKLRKKAKDVVKHSDHTDATLVRGTNGKLYPFKIDHAVDPNDMIDQTTDNKYHPDFTDVLSVLDKITKRSMFNPAVLPVVAQQDGKKTDVFQVADRFVYDLSRKSGASLKLVDVIRIKKYLTDDQEKVKFDIVIKKDAPKPSKIKMILRVSIVYNLNNIIDQNNFFDEAWSTRLTRKPVLDQAFVLGYSSGYFDIESQAQTEYYAIKDVDDTDFMTENTVDNIVTSVRRKHALETGCLTTSWDEDGRDYYVSDLEARNWGQTNRRNNKQSKYPLPCDSQKGQLYGAIGTKVLDF